MWVELQYSLHQSTSTDSFIYCQEEYEFRGAESDERPGDLDEEATDNGITVGGYIKLQSIPCEYEQAAEAKQDDPKSAPEVWFFPPPL